jgi:hypothetical protein
MGENISLKSIPSTCGKPLVMKQVLCIAIQLSTLHLNLENPFATH